MSSMHQFKSAVDNNLFDAETFFQLSNDLMIVVDFNGKILHLNNAWEKVFGFDTEELLSHNLSLIIDPEQDSKRRTFYAELIAGRTHGLDYTEKMKDSSGKWHVIVFNLIANPEEQRIYGIGRDVTQQVDLMNSIKENEERFKFLSDNNQEAVLVSVGGMIELYNKAFLKLSGYTPAELDGMDDRNLLVEEDRNSMLQRVASESEETYISKLVRKNGDRVSIEVIPSNIIYNRQKARLVLIRNLDEAVQREEARQEVENRFNALYQNSSFGILVIDLEGNILNANDLIIQQLGYSKEQLAEKKVLELVYQDDRESSFESFTKLVNADSSTTTNELRLVKAENDSFWVRTACSRVRVSPKEEVIMVLLEDIDEEIRHKDELDEVERRFETVFNSSPTGIVITKNQSEIIHCNPSFATMLGYKEDELVGKSLLDFTHEEDKASTLKMQNLVNKNKVDEFDVEKRYIIKNNEVIWAKTWVSVIERKGDEVVKVAMVENITSRKETEQKIEQKSKELTAINQELENFAYVASHDLQEPLRTIASFIQILDKRYGQTLDEDGQQFMGFVVDGAKRMQLLIRDLLEYSRVNRFNTDYEKVDLNEVFETVNRVLKEKIDDSDAVLLAENLPVIQGNKIQLTQVFQNMVDNAIKFRGKSKPEVTITVEEQPGKWLICVKDNGIGISPEYFQRIFVIFQRLHTREEYSGTGIGLALCKKIIERHGGEIWVESGKRKGTTFYFTIRKNLIRAGSDHS